MYCGRELTLATVTRDHVIPRVSGGHSNLTNVVASCLKCNLLKGCGPPIFYRQPQKVVKIEHAPSIQVSEVPTVKMRVMGHSGFEDRYISVVKAKKSEGDVK